MKLKLPYLFLGFLAIAFVFPLLALLLLSFSKGWVFPHIIPGDFNGDNWAYLFTSGGDIGGSVLVSSGISFTVATLSGFFGFITSRFIAYHRYRKQLLLLAYFPFALSPVIFALCLKFYFIKMHLTGNVLGIVLAQLIIAYPYSVIFFTGFWNQRIKQYQQLVSTMGGTTSFAMRKVVLPLAKNLFLVCFFQCFLISWFEFGLTSIIGYGKVETLTIKVFQFITEANIFYAALSCCLLITPPVLLLWFNKKFILQTSK